MHMNYAFVHMNFIIILQFSYFMIQYVYVCKDGLPMYVFMYLFLQYLHHGLWCAGLWWKNNNMDVTGIFIFLSLWDSIMLSFAALKISPLHKV